VLELVRRQLQESGMLQFTALTVDEQGNKRCIDMTRNSSATKRTRTS
jgi:hypothetical protein